MDPTFNLYAALRAGFPAELESAAIELADGPRAGAVYSWRDLDRASAQMANLLESLRLPAGARVAVQVDKSVESLLLYLAVLRAGYVYLPLNSAYQAAEIAYFLGDAAPAVVVCTSANLRWVEPLARAAGAQHVYSLDDDASGSLLELARQQQADHVPASSQRDDLAAILYTSGTTGRSKGAMLTHWNLLSNAQVLKQYWDWRPDDVLIHALPIFHVHGLFVASHGALLNGSPMIWFQKFDPAAVIARLRDATLFMGVPTLYVRMLQEAALSPQACAHMRLFISGSAPLLKDTFEQWQQRTGHTILERYGMSETTMLTSNPCRPGQGSRVAGTVGFPLPGVEVRVCNEQDEPLAAGEIGGIQVRGPNVFRGYWNMPEKTAQEFTRDGFFKTGDVGTRDGDGRVAIVGRSKDLVISGGYNVYPAEIETVLNELPAVQESAVVGVPHPDFGEAVVAVLIARNGAPPPAPDAVIAALKGKLANFKVPKAVFVEKELPRNTMGKVQKNLLRDRYQALFVQ
jgi:malonyl-CoA/methylmalonyl-CoA synthetase